MTLSEAIEIARMEPSFNTAKTLYATSDGSFFPDPDPVNLLAHAKEHNLQILTIRGEEIVEKKVKEKSASDA